VPLEDLLPYIDWTFFFAAWELKGRFPAILDHPQYGAAARELYGNARTLLDRIVAERLLEARGVYGFWPAASDDDDIIVFGDESRSRERLRFNMLRQQETMPDRRPNLSLADFVAERASGTADCIGAFAVTAGIGVDQLVRRFEQAHDDYSAILVKALADRLAEAFAAFLHARVRAELQIEDATSPEDVIAERHRGIRPGFGYPACPDHSEKFKLFELLNAGAVGLELTEHAAMLPAASVSGLYLSHPHARYFSVGRLGEDQIAAYARRKGLSTEAVERWLAPSLGYEPVRC
jgi:5-methyltetrahydrofolate--homocysteine methyltransferase